MLVIYIYFCFAVEIYQYDCTSLGLLSTKYGTTANILKLNIVGTNRIILYRRENIYIYTVVIKLFCNIINDNTYFFFIFYIHRQINYVFFFKKYLLGG